MEIQKALTFRASSIGDCLMGKYLLDNVHAQFPNARLGLVVASRGGMIRDLLQSSPHIEVLEANRHDWNGLWRLWKTFHGSDLVVTQYAGKPGGSFSLSSKLFARLLARGGGLIGFADASRINTFLFSALVDAVIGIAPAELERRALKAAGLRTPAPRPEVSFVGTEGLRSRLGVPPGPYVVVHLFAGNPGRGLHPERKKELLEYVTKQGVTVVVTGGVQDALEASRVAEGLQAIVVAGKTSVQEMIELMAGSVAIVSVDTGAAHIAAQLGKPLVVLATCLGLHWWQKEQYGPDAPVTLFTYKEGRGHAFQEYPDCINKVDMAQVAQALGHFTKK